MMRRRLLLPGIAVLCLLGLAGIALLPERSSQTSRLSLPGPASGSEFPASTESANPPATAGADTVQPAAPDADLRLLERWQRSSLRGAEVDGGVELDAHGRLRANTGLRRLFEHFLSLSGEFDPADIRRLLALHVEAEHGAAVAAAVLAVFDRYLGLRQATAGLPADGSLDERFAALQALRRQWFGDDAAALFGDDEAHTAYTLQRTALLADEGLDAAQRDALLDELDASLPAAERHAREQALSAILAEEQSRQFETLEVDAGTRYAERAALWGEDAAGRLADLDRQRAVWDQRLADYVRTRDRLLADSRLDAAARQAALDALRLARFAEHERRRVESLEAIGALPGG